MGAATLMSAINMFQVSSIIIFFPLAFALPPPPEYPTPAPTQEYNPDIGQTNVGGYGVNKNPYCHMVEKVVFENQCEPYTETTCWTKNEEDCLPVEYNNCTGVIETDIERVCLMSMNWCVTWLKLFITRLWKRRTKFRDVSPGKIEYAIQLTRLICRPRMTTSARMWRLPTALWR